MADMTITARGSREFDVRVRDGDDETSHHVSVPESLIEELDLPEDDLEGVVRESFEFLLEREPASSIMGEFSPAVMGSREHRPPLTTARARRAGVRRGSTRAPGLRQRIGRETVERGVFVSFGTRSRRRGPRREPARVPTPRCSAPTWLVV